MESTKDYLRSIIAGQAAIHAQNDAIIGLLHQVVPALEKQTASNSGIRSEIGNNYRGLEGWLKGIHEAVSK